MQSTLCRNAHVTQLPVKLVALFSVNAVEVSVSVWELQHRPDPSSSYGTSALGASLAEGVHSDGVILAEKSKTNEN
jgi:hypothetical protein